MEIALEIIKKMTWKETDEYLDLVKSLFVLLHDKYDSKQIKESKSVQTALAFLRIQSKLVGDRRFQLVDEHKNE